MAKHNIYIKNFNPLDQLLKKEQLTTGFPANTLLGIDLLIELICMLYVLL